jgi:hypothetical protein
VVIHVGPGQCRQAKQQVAAIGQIGLFGPRPAPGRDVFDIAAGVAARGTCPVFTRGATPDRVRGGADPGFAKVDHSSGHIKTQGAEGHEGAGRTEDEEGASSRASPREATVPALA